jgi:hypothetical protein
MDFKTKSSRMQSLVTLYDLHTDFFKKAIDGIKDEDANNRLGTKANHAGWITGSMVQARFDIAKQLGSDKNLKQAADELFTNYQGIKDDAVYPSLESYVDDWNSISPVLRDIYLQVTDEKFDSTFEMPEMKMTYYEFISFIIYREANMIGQLALWRRLLGYNAIKYD